MSTITYLYVEKVIFFNAHTFRGTVVVEFLSVELQRYYRPRDTVRFGDTSFQLQRKRIKSMENTRHRARKHTYLLKRRCRRDFPLSFMVTTDETRFDGDGFAAVIIFFGLVTICW